MSRETAIFAALFVFVALLVAFIFYRDTHRPVVVYLVKSPIESRRVEADRLAQWQGCSWFKKGDRIVYEVCGTHTIEVSQEQGR